MVINVLFFGDVVGRIGRKALFKHLPDLKNKYNPDLTIINGENSANGRGITSKIYQEYISNGIDCITSGNHIYDSKEILNRMDAFPDLIRPINYPESNPGHILFAKKIRQTPIAVLNVLGQIFMPPTNNPFQALEQKIKNLKEEYPIVIIDMHAEATSEKRALASCFAKEQTVSAVIGTHTHVQTADEQILNDSVAFITDVGMVGAYQSILGMSEDSVIERFLTNIPVRFNPPQDDDQVIINFVYLTFDETTGKAISIERKYIVEKHVDMT